MSEELKIAEGASKAEKYETLVPQIMALIQGEKDLTANMANVSAAIKSTFNFLWVGFYIYKNGELVLGPFQGPIACTRINMGKGVCGTSMQEKRTIIVDDVDKFPGHIACSADSRSEIVIPAYKNDEPLFLLDIDSDQLSTFDEIDKQQLTKIIDILIEMI